MAVSRHKARQKASAALAPSARRRLVRIVGPIAAVSMVGTCALAVTWPADPSASQSVLTGSGIALSTGNANAYGDRVAAVSRSNQRVDLTVTKEPQTKLKAKPKPPPPPKIAGAKFVTTLLNVWTGPGEDTTFLTVLEEGDKVAVSGVVKGIWAEIVSDGKSRWVKAAYLSEDKPEPEPEPEEEAQESDSSADGGISGAPCPSGSSVESGLGSNAIKVHRAVCANFPQVTSYGGLRPGDGGEHGSGRAIDIMISGSTGDAIADFVRANAGALGVSEVLWAQQIWTVQRGGEGWRYMEDRGSTTANHYDHVHVTTY